MSHYDSLENCLKEGHNWPHRGHKVTEWRSEEEPKHWYKAAELYITSSDW